MKDSSHVAQNARLDGFFDYSLSFFFKQKNKYIYAIYQIFSLSIYIVSHMLAP